MTTYQKIAGAVVAVVLLVIVLTAISLAIPQPSSEVSFSFGGVSNASNMNLVSIVISNPSSSEINYLVGDPELKFNGMWQPYRLPMGMRSMRLGAGQSITNTVATSEAGGEARVPILWGYVYTPKANGMQAMWEDAVAFLRTHNSRGRGALYTNFVTGIKL
jgi:hypothetical protein